VVEGIRRIAAARPDVININELRTLHLAPHEILLALSLDFDDRLTSAEVEAAVSELETRIKKRYPEVSRMFIEVQSKRAHERFAAEEAAASEA